MGNTNPSASVENPETTIDMDKKSENLIRKYQDILNEMEDNLDGMKMSAMGLKKEAEDNHEKGDVEKAKEILGKLFKLEKELEDSENTIEDMKENREKHTPEFKDLTGFEKYDAIMTMVQDPSISNVLNEILEEEDGCVDPDSAIAEKEELYTEKELEEWVEEEFKKLGKE